MKANRHLYKNFLTDKPVYNLNRGFWKRKLSKVEAKVFVPFYNEQFANGALLYDGNPI